MGPFTTLLETSESTTRRRSGILITHRKLVCLVVSIFVLVAVLCSTVYLFTRWSTLKKSAESDDRNNSCSIPISSLGLGTHTCHDSITPNNEQRAGDVDAEAVPSQQLPRTILDHNFTARLPDLLKPIHYSVRIFPILKKLTFKGFVEITFQVTSETQRVFLNVKDLIIKQDSVKVISQKHQSEIPTHKQFYETDSYVILMGSYLERASIYTISMDFDGVYGPNGVGLFSHSYINKFGNKRTMALTHLWPNHASETFPCLKTHFLRSKFSLKVARQRKEYVISNMPTRSIEPVIGTYGYYWEAFETTPSMEANSLAFVVMSHLISFNVSDTVRIWTRGSIDLRTLCTLKDAPAILKDVEEYFGTKFPLPKLDIVLVPDLLPTSASSDPGLVILSESVHLCEPKLSSSKSDLKRLGQLRHAFCHQWLAISPWTQPWLKEGLATYIQYGPYDSLFQIEVIQKALQLDSFGTSTLVLSEPGFGTVNGYLLPSLLQSLKGASVIKSIENILGQETIRESISKFLKTSQGSNSTTDFWSQLETRASTLSRVDDAIPANISLKNLVDLWTVQTGYPLVHVSKMNGSIYASQKTFIQNQIWRKSGQINQEKNKWYVPISYNTSSPQDLAKKKLTWLSPLDEFQRLVDAPKDQWIIVNSDLCVLCRINYEQDNWMKLIYQHKIDHTSIPIRYRVRLLDDSAALAKAGLLSYDVMLTFYSYIKYEEDFLPWYTALKNLKYILDMFYGTPALEPLKVFVLSRVLPIHNKLQDKKEIPAYSDAHLENLFRSLITEVACSLQERRCMALAGKAYETWVTNTTIYNPHPDERVALFCSAIAEGDESHWNFLYTYYRANPHVTSFQKDILKILGCSKNQEVLKRFLSTSLRMEEDFSQEDLLTIIESLSRQPVGKKIVWGFVRTKWKSLIIRFGHNFKVIEEIIFSVTKFINTRQYLYELEDLRKTSLKDFPSLSSVLQLSLQRAKKHQAWMKTHAGEIYQWLDDSGYTRL